MQPFADAGGLTPDRYLPGSRMTGNGAEKCPACSAAVAGNKWCATCGLEFASAESRERRTLATRLEAAEEMLQAIWRNRDALAQELSARQWARTMNAPAASSRATPAAAWSARPSSTRDSGEWTVDRIRNLLLWAGVALLALSALAFTAVAWAPPAPARRAWLLLVLPFRAPAGDTAPRD